ncbi:MAG TPA: HipA domain-containing protein [Thermoleophilaceae bacterium]
MSSPAGEVRWLDEQQLALVIDELPRTPPDDADPAPALADHQGRLAVVVEDDRVGLPPGGTPGTHVLKTSMPGLDDVVANEAYCLALACELGLPAARGTRGAARGRDYLLVERPRQPQQSFCQALGVPAERRYEATGGPSAADCFALVRATVPTPARDILALVDVVAFDLLIGNHDANANSFSLLTTPVGPKLAPLRDLVSTAVYPQLSRKLALRIGGKRRPDRVRRRQFERFAESAGLGPSAVRRRVIQLSTRAPRAALRVRDEFASRGEHPPVLGRIGTLVGERSEHLLAELTAVPALA